MTAPGTNRLAQLGHFSRRHPASVNECYYPDSRARASAVANVAGARPTDTWNSRSISWFHSRKGWVHYDRDEVAVDVMGCMHVNPGSS